MTTITLDIQIKTKNVRDNRHVNAALAIFERHAIQATLQYRDADHAAFYTSDTISAACAADFRALQLPRTARLHVASTFS